MKDTFSAADFFEDHYALRKTLATFEDHIAEWVALSDDEHFQGHDRSVESFGDHPRQTFELFRAKDGGHADGLAIFIHGGFWRAMEREQSRFVARPFLDAGFDCVIAEYRLMPEYDLGDLVEDTARMLLAVEGLREQATGQPTVLAGHSAGAHLAVHGLSRAQELGYSAEGHSLLLLSGVFDIFPVSATSIGDELQMSEKEIARWSAYHSDPKIDTVPLFVVGAEETDDFKRQSVIGSQRLGFHAEKNIAMIPGANHLTLMTRLATDRDLFADILEWFAEQTR